MNQSRFSESATNHRQAFGPRRNGFYIVMALVMIVVATYGVYSFSNIMVVYDDAAYLRGDIVRARAAAQSGIESVRLLLSNPPVERINMGGVYNNANLFQSVPVSAQDEGNVCNFSIVAPSLTEEGSLGGVRFGLQDESTRLNVNTLIVLEENSQGLTAALELMAAATESDPSSLMLGDSLATSLLLALPGMSPELADCIMDWLDADDEARPYGAESEYYSTLPTPYEPANGAVTSVEELLLVNGMTPALLFGADANRNGVLDPDEQQRYNVTVDTPGALGLANYLTVYGKEANKQLDGSFRVNVNSDDLETLYEDLTAVLEDERYASFICAYRQYGAPSAQLTSSLASASGGNSQINPGATSGGTPQPWDVGVMSDLDLSAGGDNKFTQVLQLVDATVTIGSGNNARTYSSPFDLLTLESYLPIIMDRLSTSDSPEMPGRININECPAEMLYGIPLLTEEQVGLILESRNSAGDDENHQFETWPLAEGILTLDQMVNVLPLITCGGDVYRAQVVGYFESTGLFHRREVIIDATTVNPKVIFFRDLSHLGRGFDLSVLGLRNSITETQ
ncbi:MAG: general secretion pathway protein GspK [Rhodopirellula sp. TMED11]|nr:MAG: general secretion pathway protein GspK [Rhodopirellula sp. TMED11]